MVRLYVASPEAKVSIADIHAQSGQNDALPFFARTTGARYRLSRERKAARNLSSQLANGTRLRGVEPRPNRAAG